jgi:hypothetical protein
MSTVALSPSHDEVTERIEAVVGALAGLAEVSMWALDDQRLDDRVGAAARLAASAQELLARAVGEADASGVARRAGASSTKAWLISRHKMSSRAATVTLAHARAMTPRTEATRLAWARGELDGDRAEAVAAAVNRLSADVSASRMEALERDLLVHARTLPFRDLRVVASRAVEAADPDEADRVLGERLAAQELRAYEQASFRGRKRADGIVAFAGTMPSLTFDMLMANLHAIASPRRDHVRESADGAASADSPAPDGEAAPVEPVPYASRLGQAFCDLIESIGPDHVPTAGGVNATVLVTIDEQKLREGVGTAALSTGDDVSVAAARRLACGAGILPVVLGGRGVPLDLGRAVRLFDSKQRVALAVRDHGCVFPGCDRPPAWCDAHHVTAWGEGGATGLSNGALLCGFHHRLIHSADDWQLRIGADGHPEVIPPERVDPERKPMGNGRRRRRLRPGAG